MKCIAILLAALCLCGCAGHGGRTPSKDRHTAYLDELQATRHAPYGPCIATFHYLNDTGEAGVPAVLKALDLYSGPANAPIRALIVDGAWHHARRSGKDEVLLPIMRRASEDPDASVSERAKKWLQTREKRPTAGGPNN